MSKEKKATISGLITGVLISSFMLDGHLILAAISIVAFATLGWWIILGVSIVLNLLWITCEVINMVVSINKMADTLVNLVEELW